MLLKFLFFNFVSFVCVSVLIVYVVSCCVARKEPSSFYITPVLSCRNTERFSHVTLTTHDDNGMVKVSLFLKPFRYIPEMVPRRIVRIL